MEHKIKTISELIKVVNKNNVENFLEDFSVWLHLCVNLKTFEGENVKISQQKYFHWIDDGKHDATVRLKVENINK